MSMRSLVGAVGVALTVGAFAQEGPDPASFSMEGPNLGVEATPKEVAEWDISIQPDGEGLPPGSGAAAEGAPVYTLYCFSCHGAEGQGQLNDVLVGGHGTLDGPAPRKTVGSFWPYATTVFDYIRRSMPYQQPQSLSDDQVYALTAYLLFLNGIIEEDEVLDAETLPGVRMPNRDNFILAYPLLDEEWPGKEVVPPSRSQSPPAKTSNNPAAARRSPVGARTQRGIYLR